jgi:uncharacterized damage-inducible protein DinB/putative sterol carrier protein
VIASERQFFWDLFALDEPSAALQESEYTMRATARKLSTWNEARPKSQGMSYISTLERLFRYKARANEEIIAAMRQFDDPSPAKEMAVRAICHTYVVDRIFAGHLTGTEHGYASANTDDVPTLEELSEAITRSDRWYIDYVSRLETAQLVEMIDFRFTDGAPGRMSREEMLLHVTIHGEYHRGQVGWILTESAVTPPADAFTGWLHKAEAAARRRPGASGEAVAGNFAGNRPSTASLAQHGPGMGSSKETSAMSRLDELTERMRVAVGVNSGLGKTLKFDLRGEGFIYIDGGSVTNEDKPADLTLTVTIDDLKAIGQRKLAPMSAVMSGRLRVSNMGVAAGLQGQMQALFSKMPPAS